MQLVQHAIHPCSLAIRTVHRAEDKPANASSTSPSPTASRQALFYGQRLLYVLAEVLEVGT